MSNTSSPPRPQRPTLTQTAHDERDPLLAHFTRYSEQDTLPRHRTLSEDEDKTTKLNKWKQRAGSYLSEDVAVTRADLVLIFCFFLNGMVDAGAYNAYECFVGMVTGNTIFLALGASNLPVSAPNWAWTKSLVSIVAFFAGTLFFSTLHQRLGSRRRWTLALSFILQGVMVLIPAMLLASQQTSESPAKPPSSLLAAIPHPPQDPGFRWTDLIPIALLSFQASAKILSSRLLSYPHLATVVLTVLYCDLLSDSSLLTGGLSGNPKRDQRIGGAVCYFLGALLGGALAKSRLGFEGALWLAWVANFGIAAVWAFWPKEEEDESEEDGQT